MKLEDHVPSLELCKKWKEVGGRQDTIYFWLEWQIDTYMLVMDVNRLYAPEIKRSAPLASELMEWLPDEKKKNGRTYRLTVGKFYDEHVVCYADYENLTDGEFAFKSLSNALMSMCIWIKENKK